eukprot:gnl/TRDRNA2_/TRDRNA2_161923_c1_seq1.p1 gnl/TRDRNA2_/TRDRNA2_161923_c1~~gnl/TRDRNA2_/TRDRNA2_161923_c1_seq1.p1  ORF type:complete len:203 (-),score=27.39 gnl/TRDRNA2_/TRDRNA2_161923_c1_seq1:294-812(-)
MTIHLFGFLRGNLMVALARTTLREAGVALQQLEDEDAELASQRSIFNPKASMKPWRSALDDAGLRDLFESAFKTEWENLMKDHMRSIERWCPDSICTDDTTTSFNIESGESLGNDVGTWPRPSQAAFEIATGISNREETFSRQQQVIALSAHFDALGRCAWSKESSTTIPAA